MGKCLIVLAGLPRVEPVYRDWLYKRVVQPNLDQWSFDVVIHTQLNNPAENTFITRDYTFPNGLVEQLTLLYDNEHTRLKEMTISKRDRRFHLTRQRYLQAIERATVDETYDQVLACRFETFFTKNFTIGKPKVFTQFHSIQHKAACDLDYAFMGDPFSMISYFSLRRSDCDVEQVKKHLTPKWVESGRFENCKNALNNLKTQSGIYQYLIDNGYQIDLQEAMLARHLGPNWVTLKTMEDYEKWALTAKHIPEKFL